jgi:hypothetical protein
MFGFWSMASNLKCWENIPIKWRPAILRLHQGHLEAMKLPPPDAVFTVLWFGGHFL